MQPIQTTAINLQPAYLQNHLIRLEPLAEDDFERLYLVASDPFIWEQHPQQDRYKREVFGQFFKEALQSQSAFLVFDVKSGHLIGSSRFYDYDAANNSIAIGYTFLAKVYWGGAYNAALKHLMLHYIFDYVNTVIFHIGPNNIRSQRAVLKISARPIEDTAVNKEGEERLVFCLDKATFEQQSFFNHDN